MDGLTLFLEDFDYSSEEDYNMLVEYSEACDIEEEKNLDLMCEGTNLEIRKKFKDYKKKHKLLVKELKQQMVRGDYDAALDTVKNLKKECESVYKDVSNNISSMGSVIFGFFTSWTVSFWRNLAVSLIPIVGPFAAYILRLVEAWEKPLNDIGKGDFSLDSLNFYKNAIDSRFKEMMKQLDKLEREIQNKKKESMTESSNRDFIDVVKSFIESADFNNPEDIAYAEELLEFVNSEEFFEDAFTGDFDDDINETDNFEESFDEDYTDDLKLEIFESHNEGTISDDDTQFLLGLF